MKKNKHDRKNEKLFKDIQIQLNRYGIMKDFVNSTREGYESEKREGETLKEYMDETFEFLKKMLLETDRKNINLYIESYNLILEEENIK